MVDYRLDQSGQEVQDILNGAAMQVDLTAENERATEAEQTLQGNINDEETRAKGVEGTLQDNIDAEEARAKAAEKQNADDIDALEAVVPTGASSENKLATESFVNDSVATATATFRGTYNLVSDLHLTLEATHTNIANALATAVTTANNNDFVFVQIPTSEETPTVIGSIERYKYNGFSWSYEYTLNNSGFTQAQWDAVNSGITGGDVAKLRALPTNTELTTLLNGLQGDIDAEEGRAKAAELNLQGAIDAEEVRAKAAEKANADDIDALEAVIPAAASSENKVATASDVSSLSAAIEAILLLIPSAASSVNQLADKAFVNSSIATNTGIFRGTYNLVSDLHLTMAATHAQIGNALALAILEANNNDYAFVQIPTVATAPTEIAQTDRYKFNGTSWEYEYTLNNSGFTSAQWTAINSGITSALVSKVSELPTNSELTSEIGTLVSAINAINLKIPSSASMANKLVDTAALESYIIQVLGVLTVSYNITSTDGHFSFHIEQVDGKITAVEFTTSDVASQTALDALTLRVNTAEGTITTLGNRMTAAENNITSLGGRMTTAEGNINSMTGRVSTNEEDIAQLQAAYEALTQSEIIIGELPDSGVANKIYRVPGTNSYSDYMWNGTQFVLMATYNNAIDPRPKKGSTNLVESGGIFDNMGALDISELNATENPHTLATYADLSAALAAIPSDDYKKGGMSIKFVRTYDNNYIQYRCIANEFTTDVTKWAICDAGVYVDNSEFVYVKTDANNKILWAIKADGNIYYGAGVPRQIINYINEKIAELSLDEYDNIVTFLSDYLENDTTLKAIIDEINERIPESIENLEYIQVTTDNDDKVIESIKSNGEKQINIPVKLRDSITIGKFANVDGTTIGHIENDEWIDIKTDKDGRIIEGIKSNGEKYWAKGIPTPIQKEINDINKKLNIDEDGLPVVPDYYFEGNNYLDNKILEINNEIRKCAINGDAFFWITDIHWDHKNNRLSPSLIKYIRKNTMITRLLCGGDISDGYRGANQAYLWHDQNCMMDFINKCRSAIGSNKVYATYGNHDLGAATQTYDEVFYEYGLFREDVVYADEDKTAYYVDNVPQKMRYIALGEWGIKRQGEPYENLITESVKTWFEEDALNVESGWTIVIFIHGLLTNIIGTENLMPYIDASTGTWAENQSGIIEPIKGCTDIIDIIDNYKANGGLGDIACVLMGHWHADRIHIGRVIAPATTGVPYILTQSDQFHDSHVGGLSDTKVPRTAGTITEQHFEVVVIDKINRTVKLFAIGSQARDGIDSNVGDLVDVRVVNY